MEKIFELTITYLTNIFVTFKQSLPTDIITQIFYLLGILFILFITFKIILFLYEKIIYIVDIFKCIANSFKLADEIVKLKLEHEKYKENMQNMLREII